MYGAYIKSDLPVKYDREMFVFKDQGTIALDWLDSRPTVKSNKPILCIIPGFTSNNNEIYILNLVIEARS